MPTSAQEAPALGWICLGHPWAEATQHQARVGRKKPLPPCNTNPSYHNTLIPYTGDWLQGPIPKCDIPC